MMNFIEIFEQWIKDGGKDIYMLPTIMGAKDRRVEEVLELLNYYYDKYKTDKSAIFVSDRNQNIETLALFNSTRANVQPFIDKVLKNLKIGNFAGSEEDDETSRQFVYIFIKENQFRNEVTVLDDNGDPLTGKHLYIKFQFMYRGNPKKSLTLGKRNKAKIDPNEIILKDISVHPTRKLTI